MILFYQSQADTGHTLDTCKSDMYLQGDLYHCFDNLDLIIFEIDSVLLKHFMEHIWNHCINYILCHPGFMMIQNSSLLSKVFILLF